MASQASSMVGKVEGQLSEEDLKQGLISAKDFDEESLGKEYGKIATDTPFYKPAACGQAILKGYAVGVIPMPAKKDWKPSVAIIFLLTAPTLVVRADAEDNDANAPTVVAPAGSHCMIVAGEKLKSLVKFAQDPKFVGEFVIRVLEKIKTGNETNTMWRYSVHAAKKPVLRSLIEADTNWGQLEEGDEEEMAQLPGATS